MSASMFNGKFSVLLIDGNDKDRQYYAHRLAVASSEYEVFEAANGQSGLRIYKACDIDCVVLEIDLPGRSGLNVLSDLAPIARHPEIAVIILTHLHFRSLHEAALRNGAFAVLYKPLTSGDLLNDTIMNAVSAIPRDYKKAQPLNERRDREEQTGSF